jgi:hypothetical protein
MQPSRGLTVLVCLLTLLAGCSGVPGLGGGGGGGETYGDGETLNASALAEDHAENLREAGSFTVVVDGSASVGDAGPDTDQAQRVAVDLEGNSSLVTTSVVQRQGNQSASDNRTVYVTEDAAFFRIGSGEDVRYQQLNLSGAGALGQTFGGEQYLDVSGSVPTLAATEWTRNGTVERDGETLTRFSAGSGEALNRSALGLTPSVNLTEYDATLLVTGEGTIRELTFTLGAEAQGETLTQALELRYTEVGSTTVDEPDWLDEARNASANASNSSANATTVPA